MLTKLLDEYVALRKATGFKFSNPEAHLRSFVTYAEARGDRRIKSSTAIAWASQSKTQRQRYRRLRTVARFAEHLRAEDRGHELPPARLFASTASRPVPRILTQEEIALIVSSALELGHERSNLGLTYSTLFGLIATTGMRLSEALSLRISDVSEEGLMIRKSKFGRSRLLPLHATTLSALKSYLRKRGRVHDTNVLFLSSRNKPFVAHSALMMFRRLCHRVGIKKDAFGKRARIHDLRHTFAVRALERCPVGRDHVERHMVALTTYLGHARIESTYWYLEATPRLMRDIAAACEAVVGGTR
jgi:integrase